MKGYLVLPEAEERGRLEQLVRVGKPAACPIRRANVLLAVDESGAGAKLKDADGAGTFGVSVRSIESLRERFAEEGLEPVYAGRTVAWLVIAGGGDQSRSARQRVVRYAASLVFRSLPVTTTVQVPRRS